MGTLKRLRGLGWDEAIRLPLAAAVDRELSFVLEGLVSRLMGRYPLASALPEPDPSEGLLRVAEPRPSGRRGLTMLS